MWRVILIYTKIEDINCEMNCEVISIHGMVLKVGKVDPAVVQAVYECKQCYTKNFIHPTVPESANKPKRCNICDNPDFELLEDEFKYTDYQELIICDLTNRRNRVYVKLSGDDAYHGKYYEEDFITATAKVKYCSTGRIRKYLEILDVNIKEITPIISHQKKATKNRNIHPTTEYESWRNNILMMDDFQCQKCYSEFECGGDLHAHHIVSYSCNEDVRLDPDNGITLCMECHKTFHKLYGKLNNSRDQLADYISNR